MPSTTRAAQQRLTFACLAAGLLLSACATDLKTVSPPTAPNTASITPISKAPLDDIRTSTSDSTGDQTRTSIAANGPPMKIGLLLPLGGFDQTAAIAKGMKQAAEMALFEVNLPNVQLIVKDDKGSPEGAKAAADEAIKEGAEIIVGPLFARSVPGAAAAARTTNIPVVSLSNDRQILAPNVYAFGFSPEQDVERIIGYAAKQNKLRFAAILPDDAYGKVVDTAFRASVAANGGTVVAVETYPAGANAMLGPARRIVDAIKTATGSGAPIDAVFIPGGKDVLPELGPLLTYAGFDSANVKVLGSGAWEFATIGNTPAFVGGWYPATDPTGWQAFSGRFTKAFGQPPPRVASVAYEAVNMAISLASEPPGQRFSATNLTRSTGFNGVEGTVRLSAKGVAERSLAVLEVQKIGTSVVDQAPNVLTSADKSAGNTPRPY
jgi:branched-chain amino acid transport system substrate-binding protein